jgi:hypothetical protein
MPTDIKLKNSVTATNAPTSLQQGEVAINITDKKVWVGNAATTPVLLLGSGADGTFTNLSVLGNLTFTGTGNRIRGDFSNATQASRVAFQSSTTNGNTVITAIPNGTGNTAAFNAFNNSDPTNAAFSQLVCTNTEASIRSSVAGTGTALPLAIFTNGTERLRITTGGDVGIGTNAPVALGAGRVFITTNGTTDSGMFIQSNGTTVGYLQGVSTGLNIVGGTNLALSNVAQGTGVITCITNGAERMRIDASGNVGIGTNSPSYRLHVQAADSIVASIGTSGYGSFFAQGSGTNPTYLFFSNVTNGEQVRLTALNTGILTFSNGASATERMRIDSAGNVGIGTNSPAATLHVSGTQRITRAGYPVLELQQTGSTGIGQVAMNGNDFEFRTTTAHPMLFYTNNTERMRINASGVLCIATTADNPRDFTSGGGVVFSAGQAEVASSGAANTMFINNTATASSAINFIQFRQRAVFRGGVNWDGTNTLYTSASDYRLKQNLKPLTGSGAFIDALQPKTWNWNENGAEGIGFIAHEAQAVAPNSVSGEKDAVDESGKPVYQSMQSSSSEFIANIVLELQELRKRVAQLESK